MQLRENVHILKIKTLIINSSNGGLLLLVFYLLPPIHPLTHVQDTVTTLVSTHDGFSCEFLALG